MEGGDSELQDHKQRARDEQLGVLKMESLFVGCSTRAREKPV